eukprot:6741793-Alexandrium_andersonii.AAC.1
MCSESRGDGCCGTWGAGLPHVKPLSGCADGSATRVNMLHYCACVGSQVLALTDYCFERYLLA